MTFTGTTAGSAIWPTPPLAHHSSSVEPEDRTALLAPASTRMAHTRAAFRVRRARSKFGQAVEALVIDLVTALPGARIGPGDAVTVHAVFGAVAELAVVTVLRCRAGGRIEEWGNRIPVEVQGTVNGPVVLKSALIGTVVTAAAA